TGNRGGVTDARLVVAVVAAPETDELAHQVRLFVVVLGRTDPVHRVRTAFLAQLQQAGADFLECSIPADALVLAVHELHRIAQAVFTVAMLPDRRALGTVRPQVDGGIEHRLLANPYAVLDDGVDRAAYRTVRTDRAAYGNIGLAKVAPAFRGRLSLLDQGQLGSHQACAHAYARAAQEGTAVHGGQRLRNTPAQAMDERRFGCARGAAAFSGK